jgi:hypothetical protein
VTVNFRNDASMSSPSEVKNRVEAGRDGSLGVILPGSK